MGITAERDMLDNVKTGIVFLAAILGVAFLGVDNVPDGFFVMVDMVRIGWRGFVQIVTAGFFYDMVPGPFTEDSATMDAVFTLHEWISPAR